MTRPPDLRGAANPMIGRAARWSSTNQDGTTRSISYDGCGCAGGQVLTIIDEMGKKRDQTYDVLGRLWRERNLLDSLITPEPNDLYTTTTNTYNVRDQITNITVTDNVFGVSQDTVMTYDGHGRLQTRKLPTIGIGGLPSFA